MGHMNQNKDERNIRPWQAGISARNPQCSKCTWVYAGGVFKLKFIHRNCRKHRRYIT